MFAALYLHVGFRSFSYRRLISSQYYVCSYMQASDRYARDQWRALIGLEHNLRFRCFFINTQMRKSHANRSVYAHNQTIA
jgi:hypothetical protein